MTALISFYTFPKTRHPPIHSLKKLARGKKTDKYLSCNVFLIKFAIEMSRIISQHIDF